MRPLSFLSRTAVALLATLTAVALAHAAPTVRVLLPLQRTAYQTNEWIDVSVLRSDSAALPVSDLTLTLTSDASSRLTFTFAVPAVSVQNSSARATEHYHLNGSLLRPGKYTLEVGVDGTKTSAEFSVFSHVRQSDCKLINWGRADRKEQQVVQGEDSV